MSLIGSNYKILRKRKFLWDQKWQKGEIVIKMVYPHLLLISVLQNQKLCTDLEDNIALR